MGQMPQHQNRGGPQPQYVPKQPQTQNSQPYFMPPATRQPNMPMPYVDAS